MSTTLVWAPFGAAALTVSVLKLKTRLELSKAKHPSLRGHSKMARRLARQVPFY
jgi:glutamate-1-semialdehyde 2,1-aminomutase